MSDLTALQTAWATLPVTMTTAEKMAMLNAKAVPGPARDVQRSEIRKILAASGALAAMKQYVANPEQGVHDALIGTNYLLAVVEYEVTINDTLATSDPANLSMVQQIAPTLLADPANGMTTDILNQVMALITPSIPWWKANGFAGPITVRELISAGNLY